MTLDTEKDTRLAPHDLEIYDDGPMYVFGHMTRNGEIHVYVYLPSSKKGGNESIDLITKKELFNDFGNVFVKGDSAADSMIERLEKSLPAEL